MFLKNSARGLGLQKQEVPPTPPPLSSKGQPESARDSRPSHGFETQASLGVSPFL